MLDPNTRAIDLVISPQTTTITTWNNSKNPKDGSSGMKHLERCSYTIPKNPHENKWGVVAKAWAKTSYARQKRAQVNNKKQVKGQGLKEGGATTAWQQWCLSTE